MSRDFVPSKGHLLPRPMLNRLLEQGLRYPLILVNAGPGYGKTHTVASFVKDLPHRLVWLNLGRLDNLPSHLWKGMLTALQYELPQLAAKMENLTFPETILHYDHLLGLLGQELADGPPVLFVVDNYQVITEPACQHFFEYLSATGLENFTLLVISGSKKDLPVINENGGIFTITMDELKFTAEDTWQLFLQMNLNQTRHHAEKIHQYTDGWPLAVHMTAMHLQLEPSDTIGTIPGHSMISRLFEKSFSPRSPVMQKMLVRLALLPNFSFDIIRKIGGCTMQEAEKLIGENIFVSHNYITQMYTFQNMYREFLVSHRHLLEEDEITQLFSVAADEYMRTGRGTEAVEAYGKCRRWPEMLEAVKSIPNANMSMDTAEFFTRHLALLPREFLEENPIAEYLMAAIKLNNMDFEAAHSMLKSLMARIDENGPHREILGECCLSIAAIHMMQYRLDFVDYYKKAAELLPSGSQIQLERMQLVTNSSTIFLDGTEPGALRRVEDAYREAMPYIEKVMRGGGRGMDALFSAEAAYYTFDFPRAEEYAYSAIYKAQEQDQDDIICNSHGLLAQIALIRGDYQELTSQIKWLCDYISNQGISHLFGLMDTAQGWFYAKIGDTDRIPSSIITGVSGHNQTTISVGRERLVYGNYLIRTSRYYELLALTAQMENIYNRRGQWICGLCNQIMRAIAYMRLEDESKAVDTLWYAYNLSWQNGIVTPFVEAGRHMRTLIDIARRTNRYPFDTEWLDSVYQKSSTFAKRSTSITREYNKQYKSDADTGITLTPRESEVLGSLSQGLTREEIAAFYNVSVNTIKSTIKNIYNKLGALNRADAVRIATNLGFLR